MPRILKPEYQELADEFDRLYWNVGCTCINHPPCGHCTHEGNPIALEETEDAWVEVTDDCGCTELGSDSQACEVEE